MNFSLCPAPCLAHSRHSVNTIGILVLSKHMAVHLCIILVTVIIPSNNTTPGLISLYIVIGRLSQKNKISLKDAKIPPGTPMKEMKGP